MTSVHKRHDNTKKSADSFSKAVSTKEARKILGKEFADMSDKEIDDLVTKLFLIAKGVMVFSDSSI